MMIPQFYIIVFSILSFSTRFCFSSSESSSSSSIYDVLKSHGLPMGLLPKGVSDFSLDDSGRFLVHLDQACNAKFENELHYDRNVSGTLTLGKIDGLTGISAQDLFLWFPVKEIRVDVPSSGLIYFDVGVASKQFSLSLPLKPRGIVWLFSCQISRVGGALFSQLLLRVHPEISDTNLIIKIWQGLFNELSGWQ